MTQVRDVLGRARPLGVAVLFVAASFIPLLSLHSASADSLANRSLLLTSSVVSGDTEASTVPGDPGNGDEVGHTYTFTAPQTQAVVQGISFEACDSAFGYIAAGTCGANGDLPAGFAYTGYTTVGVSVNGGAATNFTFNAGANASYWYLTYATGISLTAGDVVTVTFPASVSAYFTNPSANGTFFVHMALYDTAADASNYDNFDDETMDEGTVTSSTATAIDINTRVQETLKFSVEGDMRNGFDNDNTNNGTTQIPVAGDGDFNGAKIDAGDCTPLDGSGILRMGTQAENALSASQSYDAMSYFRIATNSANGTVVYYAGDTLQSGTEEITPIGATAASATTGVGSEQFGLAFDSDSASQVLNQLVAGAAYAGGDAVTNEFAFVTFADNSNAPVPLASSVGNGNIIECDTGAIRYVANIANETAAGIYSTRIVYIASPSY